MPLDLPGPLRCTRLLGRVSRRLFLRDDATPGRKVSTCEVLWRWTYQDSHFCSRDVPGASRSELDADCRRFLALYTRHTFAFATRGPVGPGAPSRIPPRYTSLFSYGDDGPTVPSDHHSPLGQTPHSPSPTNTRATKKRLSPSSTNGFRSLPPSCSRCLTSFFFLSSHIFADTLAALWFYMILSLRNDGHTDRYRRRLPLVSEAADGTSIVSACFPSSGERPD